MFEEDNSWDRVAARLERRDAVVWSSRRRRASELLKCFIIEDGVNLVMNFEKFRLDCFEFVCQRDDVQWH